MARFTLPYGKEQIAADIPDERLHAVLRGKMHEYLPPAAPAELVRHALSHPIGSPPLSALARGKNKVPRLVNDRRVADEILAFGGETK